jgi:partitioning defective protein 3
VGATASPTSEASDSEFERRDDENDYLRPKTGEDQMEIEVVLQHEKGPLGIHLVPEHNENGKNQGLVVQSVEKGGRIDRDGCLQAMDKIVEINGNSLIGVPFQSAQDLFRQGLNSEQLRLKVVKPTNNQVTSESGSGSGNRSILIDGEEKENMVHSQEKSKWLAEDDSLTHPTGLLQCGKFFDYLSTVVGDCKLATVSSTKKSPLQHVPLTRPGTTNNSLITSNTRKIGRKYEIDLQKGPQGLGFSITTRDNPAGGNCPIYIKNILPTVS